MKKTTLFLLLLTLMVLSVESDAKEERKPKPKPKPKPTHKPPPPPHEAPSPIGSYSWHDDLSALCLKVISDCRLVDGKYRECMQSAGCPNVSTDHGSDACKAAFAHCEGDMLECVLQKNPTYDCSYFVSSKGQKRMGNI